MTRKRKRIEIGLAETKVKVAACTLLALSALMLLPCTSAAEEEHRESDAAEMAYAEELVEQIIERYESESSYRIEFTQESYWALADTTVSSRGVLLLERPAMLSVKYDDGTTITSDGDTLCVYMSETNQYFVSAIGPEDTVIDPPRVMRSYVPDPDDPISDSRTVRAESGTRPSSEIVERVLFLIPADGSGEPARLEVTVDPGRGVVTEMAAHTRAGDSTRYRIRKTTFGVKTTPADFEFEVPPGAEQIGG